MKTFITVLLTLSFWTVGALAASPTIHACSLGQSTTPAGVSFNANFRWDAQTVVPDQKVFVHLVNSSGAMVFQADHSLPVPTSRWSGFVAYDVPINIPANTPPGLYSMVAGLWNPATKQVIGLNTGPGVTALGGGKYRVAQFTVAPAQTQLNLCVLSQSSCRPNYGFQAGFRWGAVPIAPDLKVFLMVTDAAGNVITSAEHFPAVPTSKWSGKVSYDVLIKLPATVPTGQYYIDAGLYSVSGGYRVPLFAGPGVSTVGFRTYRVGTFQVSPTAPLPTLPPPTLNLTNYQLTFNEDFTGPLDVSARGPGTRWIAHMPDFPDFGEAKFADPGPSTPFNVGNGLLRIQASLAYGSGWQSGLLSSWNSYGQGFAQQYGYFEIRAKLPKGEGTWPAFWLMKTPAYGDENITRIEVDVLEQYGTQPNILNSLLHFWGPADDERTYTKSISVTGMGDDFHRYGVLIQPDYMVFYFDGSEYWRVPTPPEAKVPLYLLVDLALGGGFSIANTPNPSSMFVDYIRVYKKN